MSHFEEQHNQTNENTDAIMQILQSRWHSTELDRPDQSEQQQTRPDGIQQKMAVKVFLSYKLAVYIVLSSGSG